MVPPKYVLALVILLALPNEATASTVLAIAECAPSAEVAATLRGLESRAGACEREGDCWKGLFDELHGVLRSHPAALWAHAAAEDLRVRASIALGASTAGTPTAEPDPRDVAEVQRHVSTYLRARAGGEDARARGILQGLRGLKGFEWVELELADLLKDDPNEREAGRAALERYLQTCPVVLPKSVELVHAYEDGRLWHEFSPKLRRCLEAAPYADAVEQYPALWALEFRFSPPSRFPEARRRVASDLARIPRQPGLSERDLELLGLGAELTGDAVTQHWVDEQLATLDPCGRHVQEAQRDAFDAAHPLPAATDSAAWIERDKAFLVESARWLERCPNRISLRVRRMKSIAALPGARDTEVLEEVQGFLDACRVVGEWPCGLRSIQLSAVEVLAFWRVGLEAAGTLLGHVREALTGEGQACSDVGEPLCWQLVRSEMRLALARSDCPLATERLNKLRSGARTLAAKPADRARAALPVDALGLSAEFEDACGSRSAAAALYQSARAAGDRDLMRLRRADRGRPSEESATETRARDRLETSEETGVENVDSLAPPGATLDWEPVDFTLPARLLVDLEGREWGTAQFEGRAVLINFWATWCIPCRAELPFVQDLYERSESLPELLVLTVNLDENPGLAAAFIRAHDYSFPVLLGRDAFPDQLEEGLPLTWVARPDRRVVSRTSGFATDGSVDWVRATLTILRAVSKPVAE